MAQSKGYLLGREDHAPSVPLANSLYDGEVMHKSILSAEAFLQRVNRLRMALLCVWFSVTFGVSFLARDWNFLWLDRPMGFWMAAQGSVLVFLIIVWVYALWVNHWEQQTIGIHVEPDLEK